MALPKIDTPTYNLTLPLSKKNITFRPFLVKEQKNLLMAMESDEKESIEHNVRQVLTNCTLTKGIDIEKLPVIDIEFYFLNLRAKSVGEVVENKYKCNNQVNDRLCGNIMESSLNILDLKVTNIKEDADLIQLTDKISIKLKYPEFSVIKRISKLTNSTEIAFEMIADSVEYIYDGEQMYYASETPRKELVEFIESLNQQQFSKMEDFFSNLPKLEKKIEIKCSRCGHEHKLDVEGLESFFG
jgi:hypothetical protein